MEKHLSIRSKRNSVGEELQEKRPKVKKVRMYRGRNLGGTNINHQEKKGRSEACENVEFGGET